MFLLFLTCFCDTVESQQVQSRHKTTQSLALLQVFNVGVVDFSSPPPYRNHILFIHKHTCMLTLPQLHSCKRGRGPTLLMRHRSEGEGGWAIVIEHGGDLVCRALSLLFVPWQRVRGETLHLTGGYTHSHTHTQGGLSSMQGRAGKAPKREMVIESPQQYKSLAEIEAEGEAVAQVVMVSLTPFNIIWLLKPLFITWILFTEQLWSYFKRQRRKCEIAASGHTSPGGWCWSFFSKWEHL